MDFEELSPAARGRIKTVELQSLGRLQKDLEHKWLFLRDYQHGLLTSRNEDFFYNPIWEYTQAIFDQVTNEYFEVVDGAAFVTRLKDDLLPGVLQLAARTWCKAVDYSLDATGFRFPIIKGMSSWNRRGVQGIDFGNRLRAALQPAIYEWENLANRIPSDTIPKKRGRKRQFTQDQLARAHAMKQAGKRNNEIAKVLYGVPAPTGAQRRSVPTILSYHGSKNRVEK